QKQNHVLVQRVELIPQRPPTTEEITHYFSLHFQNEGGFRLVVGIISRQEIGKQFSIFVNGIDRLTQEAGLTAQSPYRLPVGRPVVSDGKGAISGRIHQERR